MPDPVGPVAPSPPVGPVGPCGPVGPVAAIVDIVLNPLPVYTPTASDELLTQISPP